MKNPTEMATARREGRRISMVTCYDFWTARIIDATPIDCILVGDSAAMVMHGHSTTIPADVATIALHVAAVRRGAPQRLIVADMPFLAHRKGIESAVEAVDVLMKAGAQAVKIEGRDCATIGHVVESGVPVMGHLGLTPQSIRFRVQGRGEKSANGLIEDAKGLEAAGCFAVVLECVPSVVARAVTDAVGIPTIGIGAGPATTGQVLVLQDLLGMDPDFKPQFLRTYLDGFRLFRDALERYDGDVRSGAFPSEEESYR